MTTDIHVVSFASEGAPYDQGIPLGTETLEEWGRLCLAGGATTFKGYTPRSIIAENPEDAWAVKFFDPAQHSMPMNAGYHAVGLGGWRALILNKAMKSAKDGDIVVVHCANFHKSPCMKIFASRLREYAETVMSFTNFFAPPHQRVASYSGSQVLSLISDPIVRDAAAGAPMPRIRFVIVRVNDATRRFAQIFEDVVKSDPTLLSPCGKTAYPGHGFSHHTAEQAVFGVLAYREGLIPVKWQGTWLQDLQDTGLEPGLTTDRVIAYGKALKSEAAINN